MKNEFIPYNLNIRLKELGFIQTVLLAFYIKEDGTSYSKQLCTINGAHKFVSESCVWAILWQQAEEFFRKKGYRFNIFECPGSLNKYEFSINNIRHFYLEDYNKTRQKMIEKLIELEEIKYDTNNNN